MKKKVLICILTALLVIPGLGTGAFAVDAEQADTAADSVTAEESLEPAAPEEPAQGDPQNAQPLPSEEPAAEPDLQQDTAGAEQTAVQDDAAQEDAAQEEATLEDAAAPSAATETGSGTAAEADDGVLTYKGAGYTVALEYGKEAGLPADTTLQVREILEDSQDKGEQQAYQQYHKETLQTLQKERTADQSIKEDIASLGFARFFDITLMSGGEEIEPQADVRVTFTFGEQDREAVESPAEARKNVKVVHLTEDGNGGVKAASLEEKDTGLAVEQKELKEADFVTDRFSVYGIVYTVDFEYEGYTFSLHGEDSILLSELFARLHIDEETAGVQDVRFSDPALILVECVEAAETPAAAGAADWKLTSLKPFDTEEMLTVTTEDKIIEIKVTDAPIEDAVARVSNDNGTTWTYHTTLIDSGMQDDGVTLNGAFNQANSLSGENVIVELLCDAHEQYTLDSGFTFNNSNIGKLTIQGTENKSTLVKGQSAAPIITTSGIRSVALSNVIFDGNSKLTPNAHGGGVRTDAYSLTAENCVFQNCQAGGQNDQYGRGGGLYQGNLEGEITITNCVFDHCAANGKDDTVGGGGGGFFTDAAKVTVTGTTFTGCTTLYRQGAGFFQRRRQEHAASSCSVAGCTFTDCTSTHSGGGMESDASDTTIRDCAFTNCNAVSTSSQPKGGAINVYANGQDVPSAATTLTIEGCTFDHCTARDNGGAVRSTARDVTIKDASFNACSAAKNGGAVACTNNTSAAAITDSSFKDCHADNGNGGAFFTAGTVTIGELSAGKTLIDGCSAKNGGGVATNKMTMTGGTIQNCSAAAKGGAVNGSQITMTGGTVTGNITKGESAALDASTKSKGFIFSGNVVVEGNKDANGEDRDVYLNYDTDRHILIDPQGLGDSASIGIYVADAAGAFNNHGKPGQMFAYTDRTDASTVSNLNKLFSDRLDNGAMRGAPAVSGENYHYRVIWAVNQVAPTGVSNNSTPYLIILAAGILLVWLTVKSRARRRHCEKEVV